MKHELRDFFPQVLGIYHPDGVFKHEDIKAKCNQIKEEIVEGHDEWSYNLFDKENLCHYYNQSNLLKVVNGEASISEINNEIRGLIDGMKG